MATLTLSLEKLAFIVLKTHQLDAQVPPVLPDDASDAPDDDERQALEERDDSAYQEVHDAILRLNSDEIDELLALVMIGRGDYDAAEWEEALRVARDANEARLPRNIMANPLLGSLIEDGLDALGYSLEELEEGHL
jgi:hypothetical protein